MKIKSSYIKSFIVEAARLDQPDISKAFQDAGVDTKDSQAMIESLRAIADLASDIEGLVLSFTIALKVVNDRREEINNLSLAEKLQLPLAVLNEIGKDIDSNSRHVNVFPNCSPLAKVTIEKYLNRPLSYWIQPQITQARLGAIDEAIEKLGITAKHPSTFIECMKLLIDEESPEFEDGIFNTQIGSLYYRDFPLDSLQPIVERSLMKNQSDSVESLTLAEIASMTEDDFLSLGTIQITGQVPHVMNPRRVQNIYGFVEHEDKVWLREIFLSIQKDLKELGIT
jgi:hypothetical protein